MSVKERFTLELVQTREELDAIVQVLWVAFYKPYRPEQNLVAPHVGPLTQEAREASIKANQEQRWQNHINTPGSNWIYVYDNVAKKTIGGCQWVVYKQNPYPNGPQRIPAPQWPEGEEREFASEFLTQVMFFHMAFMQRPHLALNGMGILPDYRGKGLGDLLMGWGAEKADELGLECFTEASPLGRPLYARFGFQTQFSFCFNPWLKENPSLLWAKLAHEYSPYTAISLMWRPKGGKIEPGNPTAPWEIRS